MRRVMAAIVWLMISVAAVGTLGGPMPFQRDLFIPPIVEDSGAPLQCTVAYLVADITTNDTFLIRMRIAPSDVDRPVSNRLPCPNPIPPRLAVRALDACTVRAENPNRCVYTDMARGFEREPLGQNTASNGSRCRSDQFDFIGVACWNADGLDVCSVACGRTEVEAITQARTRCEDKHQQTCPKAAAAAIPVP
jgi:hypothetical protein